jgi:DNA-binding NtrC family response regulator
VSPIASGTTALDKNTSENRRSSPIRVLVVDGNHTSMVTACQMLGKLPMVLEAANCKTAAMHLFLKTRHSVVITGLRLSSFDGYHFVKWIKQESENVLVVSMSDCRPLEIEVNENPGLIDGWLFKPFGLFELNDTLTRLLGPIRRAEKTGGAKPPMVTPHRLDQSLGTISGIHLAALCANTYPLNN